MILTVGHSTFPIADFVMLLDQHKVDVLWDIRSHPGSKRHPQFNKEPLERSVREAGTDYRLVLGLGGWRHDHAVNDELRAAMAGRGVDLRPYGNPGVFPKQRIGRERLRLSDRPEWTNQGLYDYSWFTTMPEFAQAAQQLVLDASRARVAIMCAEVLWWKCHRSMVADYLYFQGFESMHIMGARLASHAKAIGNRIERYDPAIREEWRRFQVPQAVNV